MDEDNNADIRPIRLPLKRREDQTHPDLDNAKPTATSRRRRSRSRWLTSTTTAGKFCHELGNTAPRREGLTSEWAVVLPVECYDQSLDDGLP